MSFPVQVDATKSTESPQGAVTLVRGEQNGFEEEFPGAVTDAVGQDMIHFLFLLGKLNQGESVFRTKPQVNESLPVNQIKKKERVFILSRRFTIKCVKVYN